MVLCTMHSHGRRLRRGTLLLAVWLGVTGAQASAGQDVAFERELAAAFAAITSSWTQGTFLEFRSIEGTGNNVQNVDWGRAGRPLLRVTQPAYADGVSAPAGPQRKSARAISNLVCAQSASEPNQLAVSDFVWQWGQFIDHDLDLSPTHVPPEPFPIEVPKGDPFFDPQGTGTQVIELFRSLHTPALTPVAVRQQVNVITSYIDASNVYGSDEVRATLLREGRGGRLRMDGDLLPEDPLLPGFFLAGDDRVNEQNALTAMHTLFAREHNTIAKLLAAFFPWWSDETVYQVTRMIVGAELQAITYNEFLPVLLGPQALAPYGGYDPEVDATIANLFSAAAYRFGHSMLSPMLLRLDSSLNPIPAGHLPLKDAFFAPNNIHQHGIDPLLRGLARQIPQEVDPRLVDDVRNFLFGPPGAGGFDLAALNMQRGREHGLTDYNQARQACGLSPVSKFSHITSDPKLQERLKEAYGTVDDIDPWVGGLAEDHVPGALVGQLVREVLRAQFQRLRAGDRFFYRGALPQVLVHLVEHQTLARIIRRNTGIGGELQDDVFRVPAGLP